jgi:hypothetical protein
MNYRLKVRQRTYLWGGEGVTRNIDSHLFLSFRVDDEGEQVRFGVRDKSGTLTEYGLLNPGECYTIRLHDIFGVYASCAEDTNVECYVLQDSSA